MFDALAPLFFSDQVKIGHNVVFDLVGVAKYYDGAWPSPPHHDTIVQQWLLDENLMAKGLKDLVKRYYGYGYDPENVGKCIELHPFWKVARYAYLDVKYTWLLRNRFGPRLAADGLTNIHRLESDLIDVLCAIQMEGSPVDRDQLVALSEQLTVLVEETEARIYRCAGQRFNVNSAQQKAAVLFGTKPAGLGLRAHVLTEGGRTKQKAGIDLDLSDFSTNKEALEFHANNPTVAALLDYQEANRILTGYVRPYLGTEDKAAILYDGRLHPDLVQYGTVSGRFSCRTPNLQNIPRPGTDLGTRVRGLFVPPEKVCDRAGDMVPGKLVVADYAQIELVVLAHYAGQGRLFDGFYAGIDAHTATASALFGVPPERVSKDMRAVAKAINFAIVYGAGPAKVAAMAKITLAEAKRFLARHAELFPEVHRLAERVIRECRRRRPPHLRTILGRKRRLPTINARIPAVRSRAERQAVNSLIQGSAADLIKLAMVRTHRTLPETMRLILSVHDELVTITPETEAEECVAVIREAMEGAGIAKLLRVPLKADIKVVDRWSEAK